LIIILTAKGAKDDDAFLDIQKVTKCTSLF